MPFKRRLRNGTVVTITYETPEETIERLEALVQQLTERLAGYDKAVANCDSYDCYG